MYADDFMFLSPILRRLQYMIDICSDYATGHSLVFNAKKTVFIIVNISLNVLYLAYLRTMMRSNLLITLNILVFISQLVLIFLLISCQPGAIFTCVPAASRYCFWWRLSVHLCLSVCLSALNLENYWSEIDVTWYEYSPWWTLEVIESWWHLTLTFDLELFSYIFSFTIYISIIRSFECLNLATSFLV